MRMKLQIAEQRVKIGSTVFDQTRRRWAEVRGCP